MQAYGSVLTGGCGHRGPDLTRPIPDVVPPLPPVRTAADVAHIRDSDQRRNVAAREARMRLKAVGKRWADAREWALGTGRWTRADCPAATINPSVADAYLARLTEDADG